MHMLVSSMPGWVAGVIFGMSPIGFRWIRFPSPKHVSEIPLLDPSLCDDLFETRPWEEVTEAYAASYCTATSYADKDVVSPTPPVAQPYTPVGVAPRPGGGPSIGSPKQDSGGGLAKLKHGLQQLISIGGDIKVYLSARCWTLFHHHISSINQTHSTTTTPTHSLTHPPTHLFSTTTTNSTPLFQKCLPASPPPSPPSSSPLPPSAASLASAVAATNPAGALSCKITFRHVNNYGVRYLER
ncbi:hypothetical protein COCMIDRAFT_26673 [Bipolaris oryzae ATCC 44560]|uniref:Uncharacterized protein n=1 Tax=Bipolaris oryzae ATCC 44560 TaxID=930090 RepID=W6Z526_COCMI|nr:uncharacterized protein COCMIDRAFT_26673 [Bipolaris oryzae ATCC 44560]EUC45085.1 hypothetical protein COCMIDRAFT_26673 [Bipolaris oryzae ATCC 44560]